ncbi:hypothetical protein [Caballeronia sordidicola]|uniref:hypothetical protein n=1 Tax=Caballeronia sordidicola TaxID=196367 RepID=UPI0012FDCA74|nr:hypothetical protein [Caballeronia sordidicola]
MFDGTAIVTLRADLAGAYAEAFASAFAYIRVWHYLAARCQVVSAQSSMLTDYAGSRPTCFSVSRTLGFNALRWVARAPKPMLRPMAGHALS